MLKIAICDDEAASRNRMQEFLTGMELLFSVDIFESGEALLRSGESYQMIFLDIDMKGISGIDAARVLRRRDKKVKIIYVTAYEDFRDYAFSVHAFAYLVKPIRRERFLEILKEALEYTEEEKDELLRFETESGFLEIGSRDILYLEYLNRKIRMNTRAGDVWMKGGIRAMEEKLQPYGFAMPHKSFVVNFYHVKNLKGYDIVMSDGSLVPLSQKKSAAFRDELSAWLARQL